MLDRNQLRAVAFAATFLASLGGTVRIVEAYSAMRT
ncbi:MAG: hypothetical protein AVDCRST_MAG23-140, partial [uncultured Sphingosinicella sp.]